jgi:uncharacterized protein with NRDE domain
MCLIALALGASERYPFVIAANRDEYLDRPTAALAQWQSAKGIRIFSGRDLQGGGTWMGFSPGGRFAMLTNVRQPQAPPPHDPISRGGLSLAWLESEMQVQAFAAQIDPLRYQGFNLIVGDARQQTCFYLSNQINIEEKMASPLTPINKFATHLIVNTMPWRRVYGLSNAALDTPWPKTIALKNTVTQSLNQGSIALLRRQCLDALRDTQAASNAQLPATGVSLELERALSSVFVRHPPEQPRYGTRSSLVAVMDAQEASGLLELTEVTHGSQAQTHHAKLAWL